MIGRLLLLAVVHNWVECSPIAGSNPFRVFYSYAASEEKLYNEFSSTVATEIKESDLGRKIVQNSVVQREDVDKCVMLRKAQQTASDLTIQMISHNEKTPFCEPIIYDVYRAVVQIHNYNSTDEYFIKAHTKCGQFYYRTRFAKVDEVLTILILFIDVCEESEYGVTKKLEIDPLPPNEVIDLYTKFYKIEENPLENLIVIPLVVAIIVHVALVRREDRGRAPSNPQITRKESREKRKSSESDSN